jgi:tetratricopeptide (TPR) repeat protein
VRRELLLPLTAFCCVILAATTVCAQSLPAQSIGAPESDKTAPSAVQEVQRLVAAGQLKEALSRADAELARNPRNAQLRFVRGVIQTELKDSAAARATFERLTQDFPELPEPYNNLAVLYAADGQLDNARRALEAALIAAPNYGTAYENLGDLHLQMAADAYQRAVKLEPGNRQASAKLVLAREIITKARAAR